MRSTRAILGSLAALAVVFACSHTPANVVRAPTPARYSEADSAAVFTAAVDYILASDGGRPLTPPMQTAIPEGHEKRPIVFVRIGPMPTAAWAAPSIARLRAWRWSYMGMAIDSSRVLTESTSPPAPTWSGIFPVELVLTLTFSGDTARVGENWIWQTCKKQPGMRAIFVTGHHYIRTTAGWKRLEGTHSSSVVDGLCPENMQR